MHKIRVAFFAEILIENFDGATRTMAQILSAIPQGQFEYLIFCGEPPKNNYNAKIINLPTVTIPFNNTYKMVLPYFSEQKIRKALHEFKPQLIHIASPSALGLFARLYGNKRRIPVLTIYHTHYLSYVDYYLREMPWLVPIMRDIVSANTRSFYNKCDKILVPTSTIIHELEKEGLDRQKIEIWQRGINVDLFNPRKRDLNFIHDITGNDFPNILFVSRLVWEKNLETLVQIFEECKSKLQNANFIIAGAGVAQKSLQERMKGAIFLGMLDHERLSTLYASADVFVFTSVSESYGNVVAEAMASGLPCVIANGGGTRNFVEHGVNGYLCEANQSADYIECMTELLYNPKLSALFAKRSLDKIGSLSWDSLLKKYFQLVSQMVNDSQ